MIVAQAIDSAGNIQSNFSVPISSMVITVDTGAPTIALNTPPLPSGSYQPGSIGQGGNGTRFSGADTDPGVLASSVSTVQVQLSYVVGSATYYWNENTQLFSSYTVTVSSWFPAQLAERPDELGSTKQDINWPTDASHAITLNAEAIDKASLGDGTGGDYQSYRQRHL